MKEKTQDIKEAIIELLKKCEDYKTLHMIWYLLSR